MLKNFWNTIKDIFSGLAYESKHRYEISSEVAKAAEDRRKMTDREELIKEGIDIGDIEN